MFVFRILAEEKWTTLYITTGSSTGIRNISLMKFDVRLKKKIFTTQGPITLTVCMYDAKPLTAMETYAY